MAFTLDFPYTISRDYPKKVAYFCMEYGIHQPLKIYAGGLGYLAGSHLRSAYSLKQNFVAIGILWKYGYYDQVRKGDQTMDVLFQEKMYGFLQKTDIKIVINISGYDVFVTAYYLPPEVFQTAPLFLLSTDIPENDYLARTICHKLYDSNPETKIAGAILLGEAGAMLLDKINWTPDTYHLNESHALPLAFHLYKKYGSVEEVRKRLVFTNHTPEPGGNQKTHMSLLNKLGFFCGLNENVIKEISETENDLLDHTKTAIKLSRKTNAVSSLHSDYLSATAEEIENDEKNIIAITNAQNYIYWSDPFMYKALAVNDDISLKKRKRHHKLKLFEEVADQNGEIYDATCLTIVFAKRFGGYKRPELLLYDLDRFKRIVQNTDMPVQIIWAGKPYPMDYNAIAAFDGIVNVCKAFSNCSILVGYELRLSKLLKQGADVWLNTPRITHEACGTSGMSAAMNGALNVSIPDGWFPEFARDGINSFIIPSCDPALPEHIQDEKDAHSLYDLLEKTVIPLYYNDPAGWLKMVKQGMKDILPNFDSNRMAKEYYEKMYDEEGGK